jgi:hypothetical protein
VKDALSSLLRTSMAADPPEWLDSLVTDRAVAVVQQEADAASRRAPARRAGALRLLLRVAATMREAAARARSATRPPIDAGRPGVHTSPEPL